MLEMELDMPRPCKKRCVRALPNIEKFAPLNIVSYDYIVMSIEEYEVIRLIDLEKMTQEECSDSMNVSRTTVQSIYSSAREKIARALVEGKAIDISGGNYKVCKGRSCKKRKGLEYENRSCKQ